MSVKDNITDFIAASANEKPVAAYNAFASAVEDKVQDLLTQRQDEIRSSMFNSVEEDQQPTFKVSLKKAFGKYKKGHSVEVRARKDSEAMRKAAKKMGGENNHLWVMTYLAEPRRIK